MKKSFFYLPILPRFFAFGRGSFEKFPATLSLLDERGYSHFETATANCD